VGASAHLQATGERLQRIKCIFESFCLFNMLISAIEQFSSAQDNSHPSLMDTLREFRAIGFEKSSLI
jgi:hypothetical protein